jgi:hypothetical protein
MPAILRVNGDLTDIEYFDRRQRRPFSNLGVALLEEIKNEPWSEEMCNKFSQVLCDFINAVEDARVSSQRPEFRREHRRLMALMSEPDLFRHISNLRGFYNSLATFEMNEKTKKVLHELLNQSACIITESPFQPMPERFPVRAIQMLEDNAAKLFVFEEKTRTVCAVVIDGQMTYAINHFGSHGRPPSRIGQLEFLLSAYLHLKRSQSIPRGPKQFDHKTRVVKCNDDEVREAIRQDMNAKSRAKQMPVKRATRGTLASIIKHLGF